jgi:acetyl/propionyl-CoA carboxylase alpha subunit
VFDTVLVADRGLLACRVVRTCQRLGARAVTVHSADDAGRLHTRCADESLLLGPADPASSYLDGLKVLEAAGQAGAQAVHPGASPLAASASFAAAVQDAGLAWVGAPAEALAALEHAPPAPSSGRVVTVLVPPGGAPVVVGATRRVDGLWTSGAPLQQPDGAAAVEAAGAVGVVGLARVQVDSDSAVVAVQPWLGLDHPALELVTGVDLVEQQLRLAGGGSGVVTDVRRQGAAALVVLRARTAGRVTSVELPDGDGLRTVVGVRKREDVPAGEVVIALAAWAETDGQARERLAAARGQLAVEGIDLEEER